MNEQPLNLRASLQEIWRRRLLVTVVAVLCGVGGIIIGLLQARRPDRRCLGSSSAKRRIQFGLRRRTTPTPMPSSQEAHRSWPRLAPRCRRHSERWNSRTLVTVKRTQRAGPSDPSPGCSRVVTPNSWPTPSPRAMSSTSASCNRALRGLEWLPCEQESALLTQQIKDLQTQIDTVSARIATEGAGSSAGEQDANLLSSLRNEQNQVSLQLNSVTDQISTAQLANGSTAEHHSDTSECRCPTE